MEGHKKWPTTQIRDNEKGRARTNELKVQLFAAHLKNILKPNNGEDTILLTAIKLTIK